MDRHALDSILAIFLNKTLSRRPGVKDNDWIIFLEYDALIKPLYIFCILYPNQESLTNSPEVFPFSSRVFSYFAFAKPKKTSGPGYAFPGLNYEYVLPEPQVRFLPGGL
jgi:hypothetical protein